MLIRNKSPNYLVVDIRDVLTAYTRCIPCYQIYRHFPLSEMIQCILSVNAYEDNGEFFWMELDRRFDQANSVEVLDYELLSFLYETLISYLDENIRSKLPENIDTGEFVFHKWVSQTAVILQRDENARACNSLV